MHSSIPSRRGRPSPGMGTDMPTDRTRQEHRVTLITAALVIIGDEILDGHVADANTQVLARALAPHGVSLDRMHTVRDELDQIVEVVRRELDEPGPRLVVTSGGIGSTPDDITFEAVAAALDRPTVVNQVIEERVRGALDWQRDRGMDVAGVIESSMMRMAAIPAGARLLEKLSGWVPGVAVDLDGGVMASGSTIAVLPGVPSEFKRITIEGLVPLVAGRNPVPTVVELAHGFPESLLNPVFSTLSADLPEVKLGSYPGRPMLVRLSGPSDAVARAATLVGDYIQQLGATSGGKAVKQAWGDTPP